MSTPAAILLVEDHADSAKVLARVLRASGYQVEAAHSAAAARNAAAIGTFDLLICDISLTDGDGCDLCMELQADYGMRAIAVTGHGYPEDIARSKSAGFAFHLLKPIDLTVLLSTIEEALRGPLPDSGHLRP